MWSLSQCEDVSGRAEEESGQRDRRTPPQRTGMRRDRAQEAGFALSLVVPDTGDLVRLRPFGSRPTSYRRLEVLLSAVASHRYDNYSEHI